jgi:hypothetical protein
MTRTKIFKSRTSRTTLTIDLTSDTPRRTNTQERPAYVHFAPSWCFKPRERGATIHNNQASEHRSTLISRKQMARYMELKFEIHASARATVMVHSNPTPSRRASTAKNTKSKFTRPKIQKQDKKHRTRQGTTHRSTTLGSSRIVPQHNRAYRVANMSRCHFAAPWSVRGLFMHLRVDVIVPPESRTLIGFDQMTVAGRERRRLGYIWSSYRAHVESSHHHHSLKNSSTSLLP